MFDDAPETAPEGFVEFATADDLIQSEHFKHLVDGDRILKRKSLAVQVLMGVRDMEDTINELAAYYYDQWLERRDIYSDPLGIPDLLLSCEFIREKQQEWEDHLEHGGPAPDGEMSSADELADARSAYYANLI